MVLSSLNKPTSLYSCNEKHSQNLQIKCYHKAMILIVMVVCFVYPNLTANTFMPKIDDTLRLSIVPSSTNQSESSIGRNETQPSLHVSQMESFFTAALSIERNETQPSTHVSKIESFFTAGNAQNDLNRFSSSLSSDKPKTFIDLAVQCHSVYSAIQGFGESRRLASEEKTLKPVLSRSLHNEINTSISQSSIRKKRYITMIVALKGQLGNHLGFVARAYAIKRSMERKYMINQQKKRENEQSNFFKNITNEPNDASETQEEDDELIIHIVGDHMNDTYHRRVLQELRTCFPNYFQSFNPYSGKWSSNNLYNIRKQQQNSLLLNIRRQIQEHYNNTKLLKNVPNINELSLALDYSRQMCHASNRMQCWREQYCLVEWLLQQQKNFTSKDNDINSVDMTDDWALNNQKISLPFLTSHNHHYLEAVDEYYDDIREMFQLNEPACCGDKHYNDTNQRYPYDDEVVVHIRSFSKNIKDKGFHEMDPDQMAYELFAPYHDTASTTRIAIVSKSSADKYEQSLRSVGFTNIRQIHGKNGMEDFCFLRRTKYHLIGMKISTFAGWAAILSDASKTRLYQMDSKYTNNAKKSLFHFSFYNEQLKDRIQYETYYDNFTITSSKS